MRETIRFSKARDTIAGQICHILWMLEPASQPVVKGLNRGMDPAFQPFPRFALRLRRHFDPFVSS